MMVHRQPAFEPPRSVDRMNKARTDHAVRLFILAERAQKMLDDVQAERDAFIAEHRERINWNEYVKKTEEYRHAQDD